MDDDKSIIQKISETVKGAVDSVSEAAMQAMVPTKTVPLDPAAVAGATNEQMYVSDAAAMPQMTTALTDQKPISDKKHVENILKEAAARPAKKRVVKTRTKKTQSSIGQKAVGKNKKKVVKKATKATKAKKTKKSKH